MKFNRYSVALTLMITTGTFLILSPLVAGAQLQTPLEQQNTWGTQLNNIHMAASFMSRIGNIMTSCAEQVSGGNLALIPICMNIIYAFNNHMTQLFTEERNDMTQIMFGGNP